MDLPVRGCNRGFDCHERLRGGSMSGGGSGGKNPPAQTTYTLTITATSDHLSASTTVTLIVE